MPNQSSLKEGEQQTDEKVNLVLEESHLEPALPPPPPPLLDPSSSSSMVPPASHDPSGTTIDPAVSPSSGDLVADQIAQLFSIVGRLSSESEAHLNSFARVDVDLASSKAENQALGRTVEDQDRVIAELSRAAIPEGHWVWESEKEEDERARGKDGRWLFSLEKYKPNPPQLASGPPTSLLSLPVELTDLIFSLLPRSDVLAVCLVSFVLLQRASSTIYSKKLEFFYGSTKMYLFVSSRVVGTGSFSDRISNVLLPHVLFLAHGRKRVAVASLFEGVQGRGQIAINSVVLKPDPINPSASLRQMLPILAHFNPRELQFGCLRGDEKDKVKRRVPTVLPVANEELAFLPHWTRLKQFVGIGFSSVLVFSVDGGTLALLKCLLKSTADGMVGTRLNSWTSDSQWSETFETLSNNGLVSSLNRATPPSDHRLEGVYFIADLVAIGSE